MGEHVGIQRDTGRNDMPWKGKTRTIHVPHCGSCKFFTACQDGGGFCDAAANYTTKEVESWQIEMVPANEVCDYWEAK